MLPALAENAQSKPSSSNLMVFNTFFYFSLCIKCSASSLNDSIIPDTKTSHQSDIFRGASNLNPDFSLYWQTLKRYLDNECNASRTASEMYLHRSTLLPRLEKIKSFVALDTPQQRLYLRMCIYLYEMQNHKEKAVPLSFTNGAATAMNHTNPLC